MMPALHQNLHAARRREFVQLLIELLKRKHVMIFIFLRPIKRAEFAVNVANVRVIDVAIDDVGHDLASTAVVTFSFRQIAPRVGQSAQVLPAASDKARAPRRARPFRPRASFSLTTHLLF